MKEIFKTTAEELLPRSLFAPLHRERHLWRFGPKSISSSFLVGRSRVELSERELDEVDPEVVMLVTARGQQP